MSLIGLGGYAYAGKDSIANVLEEMGWFRTYMSAPLEQALLTLNPYIINEKFQIVRYAELHAAVGYDESKKNPEVRRLLQTLATEVVRNMFGDDVWIDLAFASLPPDADVVITGIRYPNELEAIRHSGGKAYWVDRPGFGPVNDHSSDNTLGPDDFDGIIPNHGTLEDLGIYVRTFFGE